MLWTLRPLLDRNKTAFWDSHGHLSYGEIHALSISAAQKILQTLRQAHAPDQQAHAPALYTGAPQSARVGFLTTPGREYVLAQWGTWRAGAVAVPLATSYPLAEIQYIIEDCGISLLIYGPEFSDTARKLQNLFPRLATLPASNLSLPQGASEEESLENSVDTPTLPLPALSPENPAQILYTSGTTGRPKGVLSTFKNLLSQIQTLLEAWEWSASDHTLLVLPLHHTHGIVNVLCCALAAGASLEFFPAFDPEGVWDRFQNGRDGVRPTVFMAVPTIYSKLLSHLENTSSERGPSTLKTLQETGEMESKSQVSQSLQDGQKACRSLRLMVSGSAALPVSLWNSWKEKTGHALLERYGMTEIGMALSNPLHGERRPGHVGLPLPGVQVRLSPGENEIQIKSASVFREYWGRSKETADSFTEDGWFKTGDVAEQSEDGYFKILGRLSTDIIKTGGYKVSALEIEERLREHPAVQDCSVIGIADPEWGERIAVALLKKKEDPSSEKEIESWAKERMARYKVPTLWHFVEELPRNAMGKVAKPQVKTLFQTLIKPRTGSP